MSRLPWFLFSVAALFGCGGSDSAPPDAGGDDIDATVSQCEAQGAIGAFYRRSGNPRLIAGTHTFDDGLIDTEFADPDLVWDEAASLWHLYYRSQHSAAFGTSGPTIIRHATSPDLAAWTFDETPSLTLAASGWDSAAITGPSVTINPNAPADRRFVMAYSGASGAFPYQGYTGKQNFAIGIAFSADGRTFTRAGRVIEGRTAFATSYDGILTDPEIVFDGTNYHLWFSTFGCTPSSATSGVCDVQTIGGISYATAADPLGWTVNEAPVHSLLRQSATPTSGYGQPSAIYDTARCRWELWMSNDEMLQSQQAQLENMHGLVHSTAQSPVQWTQDITRDVVWNASAGEMLGQRRGADIAARGTARYLVYVGFDNQNVPSGSTLPTASGSVAGVMTLNLAARDAPP